MKQKIILILSILILIILCQTVFGGAASATSCGDVSSDLTLTQDVTNATTCFNITTPNVVLDCANNKITFDTDGLGSKNAIVVEKSPAKNITIKNCRIVPGSKSVSDDIAIKILIASNMTILNNTIYTHGTGFAHGIFFSGTNNSRITNNSIYTNGSSLSNFGIHFLSTSLRNNISYNTIYTNGTSNNYGIYLLGGSNSTLIHNNTIVSNGSSDNNDGILLVNVTHATILDNTIKGDGTDILDGIITNPSDHNIIRRNTITMYGDGANGAYYLSSENITHSDNTITLKGTGFFNGGISIQGTNNSFFKNNTVVSNGTAKSHSMNFFHTENNYIEGNILKSDDSGSANSYTINFLESTNDNNIFVNNILLPVKPRMEINDSSTVGVNQMIYNNSQGEIKWNGTTNLTLNLSNPNGFGNERNLWIGNRTITVNSSAFYDGLQYNSSIQATLFNTKLNTFSYIMSQSAITKDEATIVDTGKPCETSPFCDNISLDPVAGRAVFNFSYIMSYAVDGCGTINRSRNLGGDYVSNVTCFTIEKANVDLNCQNNDILFNTDGSNYTRGINSTGGLSNISVSNCDITGSKSGFIQNYGMRFKTGRNVTLLNNTIYTYGTKDALGIEFRGITNSSIINNSIFTNGTGVQNYGVRLLLSSKENNVTGNIIRADGNGSAMGIRVVSSSSRNRVTNNSITTNGGDTGPLTNNRGIETQTNNNKIESNHIITNGLGSNHGIYVLIAKNNSVSNNIIITNGSSESGIYIDTRSSDSNVTHNNITILGGTSNTGIKVRIANSSLILNNTIGVNSSGGSEGIELEETDFSTVQNNNVSIFGSGTLNKGIFSNDLKNLIILNNTVSSEGSSFNFGINLRSTFNSKIINNTVETGFSSSNNIGLNVSDNSSNINITGNSIITNGTQSNYGIDISNNVSNLIVLNNSVRTNGSSFSNSAIRLKTNVQNVSILNNTLVSDGGTNSFGIDSSSGTVGNLTIKRNKISTLGFGRSKSGIWIASGDHFVEANNITVVAKNLSHGILLNSRNSLYLNNNISAGTENGSKTINDITAITNTLIYNNSFGEMRWDSDELDANISLVVGQTLFLQNNLLGLIDSLQTLNLNSTANITFRGLTHSSTPQLLKDGTRCDNLDTCNITSYNTTTGILLATVSSFSNYTTSLPTPEVTATPRSTGGGHYIRCEDGETLIAGRCIPDQQEETPTPIPLDVPEISPSISNFKENIIQGAHKILNVTMDGSQKIVEETQSFFQDKVKMSVLFGGIVLMALILIVIGYVLHKPDSE